MKGTSLKFSLSFNVKALDKKRLQIIENPVPNVSESSTFFRFQGKRFLHSLQQNDNYYSEMCNKKTIFSNSFRVK